VQGPKMLRGDFDVAFPLKHQRKDLRLALALASSLGKHLPLSTAADQYFLQVSP
jgi:glyoxylate/succinic semialdehyde reductase